MILLGLHLRITIQTMLIINLFKKYLVNSVYKTLGATIRLIEMCDKNTSASDRFIHRFYEIAVVVIAEIISNALFRKDSVRYYNSRKFKYSLFDIKIILKKFCNFQTLNFYR